MNSAFEMTDLNSRPYPASRRVVQTALGGYHKSLKELFINGMERPRKSLNRYSPSGEATAPSIMMPLHFGPFIVEIKIDA